MPQPHFRYRRSFFNDYFPPGLKWLILTNVGVFLVYFLGGNWVQRSLTTLFALYPAGAARSLYVWQIFTAASSASLTWARRPPSGHLGF